MNFYCLSLEIAQGCTRRCDFCAIHSIIRQPEDAEPKLMSLETADLIAKQVSEWREKYRICFALFGEPLLNPMAADIVSIFRKRSPKVAMTMLSNGDLLKEKKAFSKRKFEPLFVAGINSLVIDYYGKPETYGDFRDALFSAAPEGVECVDLYNVKTKYFASWQVYKNPKITKELVLVDNNVGFDRSRMGRRWDNQGGNVPPQMLNKFKKVEETPIPHRCVQHFRDLVVLHDGVVVGCCLDWRREMVIGKVSQTETLRDIWDNRIQQLCRKALFERDRFVVPCKNCDYKSRRVGLLENPLPTWTDEERKELLELQKQNSVFSSKYAYKEW